MKSNSNVSKAIEALETTPKSEKLKRFESKIPKEEKDRIRNVVKELSKLQPAKVLCAILFNWTCIIVAIYAGSTINNLFLTIFFVFFIASRQHALLAMMHDAAHFRFVENPKLNDLISDIFCAFPHFITTLKYRGSHLKHHKHLNTDRDPDWKAKKGKKDWEFPKTKKEILILLCYHLIGYGGYLFISQLYRYGVNNSAAKNHRPGAIDRVFRITYYILVISVFSYFEVWSSFLIYWTIPLFTVLPFLLRLRSMAEHFGLERTEELNSTRNVKVNILERIFIASQSVYYHLDHHLYPSVPYYNLRKLHQTLMKNPEYAANAANSRSYLGSNSNSVLSELSQPQRG